jgi:lipoate-protein ligase A
VGSTARFLIVTGADQSFLANILWAFIHHLAFIALNRLCENHFDTKSKKFRVQKLRKRPMICILNTDTEPAFNLAAEEYLLRSCRENVFMLWRNRKAIVVGCNQNSLAQINADAVRRENIPVIRRISGGGTVYHDMGNINYTIIRTDRSGWGLSFRDYLAPVRDFLLRRGIDAQYDGRSDLSVHGLKISGNAQHRHRDKVLHHGTILFDADLAALARCLQAMPEKFRDKAIDSVRKPVTNVSPYLDAGTTAETFMEQMMTDVQCAGGGRRADFSRADRKAIGRLVDEKYARWEWNFGRSPKYQFLKITKTAGGVLDIRMTVDSGIISDIRILGDYLDCRAASELEAALVGCPHRFSGMTRILTRLGQAGTLHGESPMELAAALF